MVFSRHQAIASFKRSPLGYNNTSITSTTIYFSYIPEVVVQSPDRPRVRRGLLGYLGTYRKLCS